MKRKLTELAYVVSLLGVVALTWALGYAWMAYSRLSVMQQEEEITVVSPFEQAIAKHHNDRSN